MRTYCDGLYDLDARLTGAQDSLLHRPDPVPKSITRKQLLQALAASAVISSDEARAAARTGAVPAAIATVFDTIADAGERLDAELGWASAADIEPDDPVVALLAAARQMSDADIADLFRTAGAFRP